MLGRQALAHLGLGVKVFFPPQIDLTANWSLMNKSIEVTKIMTKDESMAKGLETWAWREEEDAAEETKWKNDLRTRILISSLQFPQEAVMILPDFI